MSLIAIAVGVYLLIKGGDWLMKASVALSLNFSIPKIVIGMTVVSFATSAPELIVSVKSALTGHPDLAIGNVVGSNIANLGLVLALTVIISPINVSKSFYKSDWPMMIFSSILFYFFISKDERLDEIEGLIMFSLLILFIIYIIKIQKNTELDDEIENEVLLTNTKILIYLLLEDFPFG